MLGLLGRRARAVVVPFHLARSGIQRVDVRAVVVGDAGCRVNGPVLDDNATRDRPRGNQLAVDRNPPLGRRGAESPQRTTRCGFERIHATIGRSDEQPATVDRRREVDRAAGERLPLKFSVGSINGSNDTVAITEKHKSASRNGCGGKAVGGNIESPRSRHALRDFRVGGRTAGVIALMRRPVAGFDVERFNGVRVCENLQSRIFHAGLEIEIARGGQTDMPIQRELAAAHPRSPIKVTVRDDHTVLAGRTHRGDVSGDVRGRVDSHGSARGSVEDAVHGTGSPRARAAHVQIGQHLAVLVGEFVAGFRGGRRTELRADRVDRVVAEY